VISRLKNWWQVRSGEEDTPFDGDSAAFLASVVVHVGLLLGLGLWPLVFQNDQFELTLEAPLEEETVELKNHEEVFFSEQPSIEIGANSDAESEMAFSEASIVSDISDIPIPLDMTPQDFGEIEINVEVEVATGLHYNEILTVKGHVGEGITGATGAIDRITHEILLSLDERKTLVLWLFDQSGSLARQRKEIHARFDRIYEELGILEAAKNPAFAQYEKKPLVTSVYAFGSAVMPMLTRPTDNLVEIKQAVKSIEQDDSGVERAFQAIYEAVSAYSGYRAPDENGEPKRNVMVIVVTDEAGDDQDGVDETSRFCQKLGVPVYVIGVPAPFGRRETLVKWVDPDPKFHQKPQWGRVNQGPESFLPERIKLHFANSSEDTAPIDAGFGPFSLTRLCYETGGIYFAVHPNRNVSKAVSKGDTATFSAHIKHFFDPEMMRRYRPEYVSAKEYLRRIKASTMRSSLMNAAAKSWVTPMKAPRTRFVKRNEATLANELSEAQKLAAQLEPKINSLYEVLKLGESSRPDEQSVRWQASYDLAMGRVLAVKVRTEAYNAMLAQAKRGLKFKDAKNNTWQLEPADDISVGSQLTNAAAKAREYLDRTVKDHPGTPWALLAQRELNEPIGWKWTEHYTDLAPPRQPGAGGDNNPRPAVNDTKRVIKKPLPKRKPPAL
jgi:hypothetical protein